MTKILFRQESSYQTVCVGEQQNVRFLRFGDASAGWQGACVLNQPKRLYFPYQQAFSLHTAWVPTVENFLSIGVGTGTALTHIHWRHPEARMTGIELDGMVLHVAEQYFGLSRDAVQLIEADARACLDRLYPSYDLIFLDAYYQEDTPSGMLCEPFLKRLADLLIPGGVLAINAIMTTFGPGASRYRRLCNELLRAVGPTFRIDVGILPFSEHNLLLYSVKKPTFIPSIERLRARARAEIAQNSSVYGPFREMLPARIKAIDSAPNRSLG
ncbi:spermidine synthase [Ferroacidibacillus organovorans]|uniref:Methyltransferase domain-containing protein n=1 Tax=Ferroacidibacillus organovorans TaxID=1765683 RepID=A0A853KC54_9BACL|nr:fused MFS/spermidine synthase [Ferroacidibacillus organovorans]KYP80447.1 hypothetical protein AYJ22_02005 [Ferroacidibacillus organovorans]OAG94675.1 hypothetical protein AYW79_03770 [Ferroacidibacillus organovorans]